MKVLNVYFDITDFENKSFLVFSTFNIYISTNNNILNFSNIIFNASIKIISHNANDKFQTKRDNNTFEIRNKV